MNEHLIVERFRALSRTRLERPGNGATSARHRAIFDAGRENLSLAKLIEAHWDAVSILQEAGKPVLDDTLYAVWANEIPGRTLILADGTLSGVKDFCSGAGLVDRALVTVASTMVEVDLRSVPENVAFDYAGWKTEAFLPTRTAGVTFHRLPVFSVVGTDNWYTNRTGFWQGACGPASAWAGGAAGLVDAAMRTKRDDPHTTVHLAAMSANVWAMESLLESVGDQFDLQPAADNELPALQLRHIVEQLCTDTLHRFARALGPAPLVKDASVARRYAELDLFLRQCHAERDLESLGRAIRRSAEGSRLSTYYDK